MSRDETIGLLETLRDSQTSALVRHAFNMAIAAVRDAMEPKPEQIGSLSCMNSEKMHDRTTDGQIRREYSDGYADGYKQGMQDANEQIKWERDTALQQLADIGYGLGETPRDVVVVTRCRECNWQRPNTGPGYCTVWHRDADPDGYCHKGAGRDGTRKRENRQKNSSNV